MGELSFDVAEWLSIISVVVAIVVAIQSARFAREERKNEEIEQLYSLLYHHISGYGKMTAEEKQRCMTSFFEAVGDNNQLMIILFDIEPLYRQAWLTRDNEAFEKFAKELEEMYLTHSDYLLWHRNMQSREDERMWRTVKLTWYRTLLFVHTHSMRIIMPFALFSVLVGYVQYTEEQYGVLHYSYTSLVVFIIMSIILYIHSHPKRWKAGMNRQLGDLTPFLFVHNQIKSD